MPIDMSQAIKAPPKKATSGRGTAAKAVAASASPPAQEEAVASKRARGLMGLAQLGQGICLMTGQYADAANIGTNFPPLATELANLADEYESVAKPLDFLIQVGPFTAVIAAGMPFILQTLANHRVIKAEGMMSQGVVPPEVLRAQMLAQVAKIQATAMREQQQAMREANAERARYEAFMAEAENPTPTAESNGNGSQ
jgi:hypothetical protein